jgi:amylosucrase
MLGLYNVTDTYRAYPAAHLRDLGLVGPVDAISGREVIASSDDGIWLPPYAFWWVVDRVSGQRQPRSGAT